MQLCHEPKAVTSKQKVTLRYAKIQHGMILITLSNNNASVHP
jgi:hypothetical protein